MSGTYQYNYSQLKPSVFDTAGRQRKAATMVRVCQDFLGQQDLKGLSLLDVGSSSGIIDSYLANHFGQVTGIDIDEPAMKFAQENFRKPNLNYRYGDAMNLEFNSEAFDVVVCSHVYEHVPDPIVLFNEIFRVLKPGGFCYFSGNNKLMLMEPHYKLPLLSLLPQRLANLYLKAAGKGDYYHEKHLSYRDLMTLCRDFSLVDYSPKVIATPAKFGVDYMLKPGTLKWRTARWIATHAKWATPHIWVLHKPFTAHPA